LLGSQDIAAQYKKNGVKVVGMFQLDMCGYYDQNREEHIGIITDYVNPELTGFLVKLVETYSSLPYRNTTCGYACSDHASWYRNGFPSSFAYEEEAVKGNPYYHSVDDVVEHIDFKHAAEYVKLALGFAVELAGWD
jgi:Zn-dependent M28 family amino/carboxypeptidase